MDNKLNVKQAKSNSAGAVSHTLDKGRDSRGRQTTASREEQVQRASDLQTQGRKGCKAPRFNVATTPENFQFVSVMAKVTGRSVTKYINFLIDEYKKDHPEIYKKALEIMREAGMEDEA